MRYIPPGFLNFEFRNKNLNNMNEKSISIDRMSQIPLDNEIILYQPDSTLSLQVKVENDTVWLSQAQMAELFDKDQSVVARHISNIFKEEELEKESNMQILHNTLSKYKPTQVYSLDVIISVGYRVKSKRGTLFRQWANRVLKEYLLRGYSVNQRFRVLEDSFDRRFLEHERRLDELSGKVDFFVRTSLPPREGILYDGQIFDAYVLISDLIRMARCRVVLIDNYVDDRILKTLDKRDAGVSATIYTNPHNSHILLDLERHNAQYPKIEIRSCTNVHDRFLIIDDTVYFIGGSVKDLGKKIVAFSRMYQTPDDIISKIKQ